VWKIYGVEKKIRKRERKYDEKENVERRGDEKKWNKKVKW
jgi:hypothetical protein